jgi:hypothetical protein
MTTEQSLATHRSQWQKRVGCRPSLLTKAAIQATYSLNVGHVRDTGHSSEATPAAALADGRPDAQQTRASGI